MAKRRVSYEQAGVSIDSGNRAVDLMKEAVRSTYDQRVLAGIGSFGGVFDISHLSGMQAPALVASTDGVGTKTKLAAAMGQYESIGHDIVNHCINDILVQGARPLFFLDYIAASRLNPEMVATVVCGIASACRQAGCALLGGETAEMPGVYEEDEFDLVGTIVGVVERERILPLPSIQPGDIVLGFASSGPHTNGYSLIRHLFAETPWETDYDGIGPLGKALLAPHRSYLAHVDELEQITGLKALAHITGGGLVENLPRILPGTVDAHIDKGSWPTPALFRLIQENGDVPDDEMYRVFNMGIGMAAIVPAATPNVQELAGDPIWPIGTVTTGTGRVIIR